MQRRNGGLRTGTRHRQCRRDLTEADRLAPVIKAVEGEMARLGHAGVTTRVAFADLVRGLDLTNDADARMFAALMNVSGAFAQVHAATENLVASEKDLAAERKNLQDQLDKLMLTSAQLRAKDRLSIDATNRALFDQLAARQDIANAYERESSVLQTTIERTKNFTATLTGFIASLNQGALSPLTPVEKNADAKKTYDDLLAKAKGGDAAAQSQVTGAAQTYLAANRTINASSPEYTAVFAQVQKDMDDLLKATGAQQSEAEKQLAQMKTLAGALVNLDDSVVSLTAAIEALRDALHAAPGGKEIEGMYKDILGRDSDTAGLSFWTGVHANGGSLAEIKNGITMSDEAQGRRGAEIENLYTTLLGRASDTEGKKFWLDAYNGGQTLDAIRQEFMKSPEYIASHASGLERVPYDGYRAKLHKGEAVIDAPAMAALTRYFGGGGGTDGANTSALVAEIRALRAEVAALRADNERQAVRSDMTNLKALDLTGAKLAESTEAACRAAEWASKTATKGVIA